MPNTQTDHGADGPAMLARPSEMLGNDRDGLVKRYSDVLILDALAVRGGLGNDRETKRRITAGEWFASVHARAFPQKNTTGAYGNIRGGASEGQVFMDSAGKEYDSCVWHRGVIRDTEYAIGKPPVARLIDAITYGKCPDPAQLRADLDALAQHRGIS